MSKQIYLYSEDKKYKCGIELADPTDHFSCPEHSIMVLTEERENGIYVIAEARDKLLETEKDKELQVYKKALELAYDGNFEFGCVDCQYNKTKKQTNQTCPCYDDNDDKRDSFIKQRAIDFYIEEARKESEGKYEI